MVELICKQCKKKFSVQPYRRKTAKFCSVKCMGNYNKKSYKGNNSVRWKEKSHIKLNCLQCGHEYNELIQRKGRSKFCSRECLNKWMSENLTKEKRYNWKGGTKRRNEGYYNLQYKLWRESVFKRDDYTCQWCGKRGCYLEAHHKKLWTDYPELRFDIDNGITLCKDCHNTKGIHKWGCSRPLK